MESYKAFVRQLSDKKENRVFLNSDPKHALEVLTEIFRQSESVIRIFAASLCREVSNEPDYIEALSDFIEKDGQLRVLLNRYDPEEARQSNLFKRLAYYESLQKDISIKKTNRIFFRSNDPDKKEVHFTVGDDRAYRIETDIELRTASCNLNDPETARKMIAQFDEIFGFPESEPIHLLPLFE